MKHVMKTGLAALGLTVAMPAFAQTVPATGQSDAPIRPSAIKPANPMDAIRNVGTKAATADWQITGLQLAAEQEESHLVSGGRPKLMVSVRRLDGANKIPDAVLTVTIVPSNAPVTTPPQNLYLKAPGDGKEQSYPIYFDVPAIGNNGRPIGTTNLVVTAKLSFPNADGAKDSVAQNDIAVSSIVINRPKPKKEYAFDNLRVDLRDPHFTGIAGTSSDITETFAISEDLSPILNDVHLWRRTENEKACGGSLGNGWTGDESVDVEKSFGACGTKKQLIGVVGIRGRETLTGLSVCQNQSSGDILGLRSKYLGVRKDGEMGFEVRYDEWNKIEFCNNWSELASCPAGMGAGGLTIAYGSTAGGALFSRYVKGLGLVCGPIVPKDAG